MGKVSFMGCVLLAGMLSMSAFGLQRYKVSPNDTVKAEISSLNKSRIFVDGERILDLRGTPGAYAFVNDPTNGQVFITPTKAYEDKAFNLFVTTTSGNTYDLELNPVKGLSKTIELKPKQSKSAGKFNNASAYNQTLVKLIRYMVNGVQPEGYAVFSKAHVTPLWLGNIAKVTLVQTYQGQHLDGHIYKLVNLKNQSIRVAPREFYQSNTRALAVANTKIAPHGVTYIYEVTTP